MSSELFWLLLQRVSPYGSKCFPSFYIQSMYASCHFNLGSSILHIVYSVAVLILGYADGVVQYRFTLLVVCSIISRSLQVRLHSSLLLVLSWPLKFVTWNIRGLLAKPKRIAILSHLKSLWADISILVETHVTGQLQVALKKKPWVGWLYQAPCTSSSRGVAILIAKTVQFQLHGSWTLRAGFYFCTSVL